MTESNLGRKGLIGMTNPNYSSSLRKVRVETEAEAEARSMEDRCLLAYSSWLAQFAYLHNSRRAISAGVELPTVGSALPH